MPCSCSGGQPERPLSALSPDEATDAVLDAAWSELAALHALGVAHQGLGPEQVALGADGAVSFVDLATAAASASTEALLADRAALLVTLAVVATEDRAVASGVRALGPEHLGEVLTVLQGAALPRSLRRQVHDVRHLTSRLREAVAREHRHRGPEAGRAAPGVDRQHPDGRRRRSRRLPAHRPAGPGRLLPTGAGRRAGRGCRSSSCSASCPRSAGRSPCSGRSAAPSPSRR